MENTAGCPQRDSTDPPADPPADARIRALSMSALPGPGRWGGMHQHIRTSLQLQIAPAGTHFFQNNCTHGHDSKDARSSASAASSSRSGLQITVTAELRFALPTGCYADLYELRALQAQAQLLLPHEDEGFNPAHSSIHTYTSTHKHTVLTFPQLLAVTVVPDGQVAMETVARSPLESGIESESGSGGEGEGAAPHQTVTMRVQWDVHARAGAEVAAEAETEAEVEAGCREAGAGEGEEEVIVSALLDLPLHLQYGQTYVASDGVKVKSDTTTDQAEMVSYRELSIPPPQVYLCGIVSSDSAGAGAGAGDACTGAGREGALLALPWPAGTGAGGQAVQLRVPVAVQGAGGAAWVHASTDLVLLLTALAVLLTLATLR